MVHEKNWRVRVSAFRNSVIHEIFPEFSHHSGMSEHNGSSRSQSWSSFLFGCGFLVGLGHNGSPRSFRSTCELDTGTGWESIPLRSFCARVSLSLNTVVVGEVDCVPVLKQSLILKNQNWKKNSLTNQEPRSERSLRVALYSNTVFNKMWFLTIDQFIRMSVFIAKLSERQYCWRVFEDFHHSQEHIQFFDIRCGLFIRLHFFISSYDRRKTTRFRQSIHFSRIQLLFADHVHWRSGVDNKFSSFRFKSWFKQASIFWRWEECCFVLLL